MNNAEIPQPLFVFGLIFFCQHKTVQIISPIKDFKRDEEMNDALHAMCK